MGNANIGLSDARLESQEYRRTAQRVIVASHSLQGVDNAAVCTPPVARRAATSDVC